MDTKDVESWRGVFAPDLTVLLDGAVSTGGADPKTGAHTHVAHHGQRHLGHGGVAVQLTRLPAMTASPNASM
ncbi:hypothetical protein ACTXG7_04320 [Mycolicibacterium sp. Dal123E01]|uniref:hypothetical protein n=1 Tax=Mycolicibacterium sp. Dal123E01 TaxID=3457578 RepID=UPI00403E500E